MKILYCNSKNLSKRFPLFMQIIHLVKEPQFLKRNGLLLMMFAHRFRFSSTENVVLVNLSVTIEDLDGRSCYDVTKIKFRENRRKSFCCKIYYLFSCY